MGAGINKCITVAEILKRRIVGLHQWNQIKSIVLEVVPPQHLPDSQAELAWHTCFIDVVPDARETLVHAHEGPSENLCANARGHAIV